MWGKAWREHRKHGTGRLRLVKERVESVQDTWHWEAAPWERDAVRVCAWVKAWREYGKHGAGRLRLVKERVALGDRALGAGRCEGLCLGEGVERGLDNRVCNNNGKHWMDGWCACG